MCLGLVSMQEACSFITCHRRLAFLFFFFTLLYRTLWMFFNIFIRNGKEHLVDFLLRPVGISDYI